MHPVFRYIPSKSNDTMPTRQSQIVAQQLFTLKTTINHLKNAYNGNDVEWPDNDDGSEESGSGSGSGIDDEDDDDGSGIRKLIKTFIIHLFTSFFFSRHSNC